MGEGGTLTLSGGHKDLGGMQRIRKGGTENLVGQYTDPERDKDWGEEQTLRGRRGDRSPRVTGGQNAWEEGQGF